MAQSRLLGAFCSATQIRQLTTSIPRKLKTTKTHSAKILGDNPKIISPLAPTIFKVNKPVRIVAPVNEKTLPKVLSPFSTHVQAWLRDFRTLKPIDILNISADVFAAPIRRDLLHRAVVFERDGLRQGTHSALSRAEVSGTGRKAFPQKGRGAARVHSLRAPQFRGGGKAFPVKPRDYTTGLQRKVFLHALRVLLSARYAQNQLYIVNDVDLESHKTRELASILAENDVSSVMFLSGQPNDFLELAVKNIPGASLGDIRDPKIFQLMLHKNIVLDKLALAYFEDTLAIL